MNDEKLKAWERDEATRPLTDAEIVRMEANLRGDGPTYAIQSMSDARRLLAVIRKMRTGSAKSIAAERDGVLDDVRSVVTDIASAATAATSDGAYITAADAHQALHAINRELAAGNYYMAQHLAGEALANVEGAEAMRRDGR